MNKLRNNEKKEHISIKSPSRACRIRANLNILFLKKKISERETTVNVTPWGLRALCGSVPLRIQPKSSESNSNSFGISRKFDWTNVRFRGWWMLASVPHLFPPPQNENEWKSAGRDSTVSSPHTLHRSMNLHFGAVTNDSRGELTELFPSEFPNEKWITGPSSNNTTYRPENEFWLFMRPAPFAFTAVS